MLQADYLINTVAESSHLLAALMESILREAELHDVIIVVLPLVVGIHCLNQFKLFSAQLPHGIGPLFGRHFLPLIVVFVVEVVEGYLPDACEQNLRAMTHLGDSAGEVASLF